MNSFFFVFCTAAISMCVLFRGGGVKNEKIYSELLCTDVETTINNADVFNEKFVIETFALIESNEILEHQT